MNAFGFRLCLCNQLLLEEVEHGGFLWTERVGGAFRCAKLLQDHRHGVSEVAFEDGGVDVALAADGGGVA